MSVFHFGNSATVSVFVRFSLGYLMFKTTKVKDTKLKALPHGCEKPTSRTTRRCGMRIPTAKRGEVKCISDCRARQTCSVFTATCSVVMHGMCTLTGRNSRASLRTLLSQYPYRNFFKSRSYNYKVEKYETTVIEYCG